MNSPRLIPMATCACLLTGCFMFTGYGDKVADTFPQEKMLKPDPALRHEIVEAARRKAAAAKWKEDFVVAAVTDIDWTIRRNRESGVLTGRGIVAAVGCRLPDGKCCYKDMIFVQQHDGREFAGPLFVSADAATKLVVCSALPATE